MKILTSFTDSHVVRDVRQNYSNHSDSDVTEAVILPNISFCIPRKKESHEVLNQHLGELLFLSELTVMSLTSDH